MQRRNAPAFLSRQYGRFAAIIVAAAAVLIPAVILVIAGFASYREANAEGVAKANRLATALGEHALRTFRAQSLILDLVDGYVSDTDWERLAESGYFTKLLARVARDKEDIASVHVAHATGLSTVSNVGYYRRLDVRQRDYFVHAREIGSLYISAPATGVASGRQIFSMSRPIGGSDGGFRGVVVVSVYPQYFEHFYSTLLMPGDAAALIRGDGVVLARYPSGRGAKLASESPFMSALKEGLAQGSFTSVSSVDGSERIVGYRKIGNFDAYAVVGQSKDAVWMSWRDRMRYYVLAAMAAGILLLWSAALIRRRTLAWLAETDRRLEAETAARESAELRVRERDTFIASLSHELRNPLSAIANGLHLIQATVRNGATERLEGTLGICVRQVGVLRSLLDELLDASRVAHGKLTLKRVKLDLAVLLQQCVQGFDLRGQVEVACRIHGPAWVEVDPARIEQVVSNLLDNAVKFGASRIEVAMEQDADFVWFSIEDDGRGMSEAVISEVFIPFRQGAPSGMNENTGLGLGLSIVRGLVMLHGGSIEVHSDGPGCGTLFVVRLPKTDAAE